jgi:dodecin
MSVGRITEITARSGESFEDAVNKGIERASQTLRNVQSVWIAEQKVTVKDGKPAEYHVDMKVTFVLE